MFLLLSGDDRFCCFSFLSVDSHFFWGHFPSVRGAVSTLSEGSVGDQCCTFFICKNSSFCLHFSKIFSLHE